MMGWMERIRKSLGFSHPDADTEVADEFGVTPWANRGQGAAGTAEDYQIGPDDGVRVAPMPVTSGANVDITYTGLLARSGADQLYVRCGEGPGPWQNLRDVAMERSGASGSWHAELKVSQDGGTLEFCFHDGADMWDNNRGRNWSVTVHGGGKH